MSAQGFVGSYALPAAPAEPHAGCARFGTFVGISTASRSAFTTSTAAAAQIHHLWSSARAVHAFPSPSRLPSLSPRGSCRLSPTNASMHAAPCQLRNAAAKYCWQSHGRLALRPATQHHTVEAAATCRGPIQADRPALSAHVAGSGGAGGLHCFRLRQVDWKTFALGNLPIPLTTHNTMNRTHSTAARLLRLCVG